MKSIRQVSDLILFAIQTNFEVVQLTYEPLTKLFTKWEQAKGVSVANNRCGYGSMRG